MFGFLTSRHAAQAAVPLPRVRFTSEDLFVLLGGADAGQFAVDEYTVDFDRLDREGMGVWRRAMAARLAPTGLVDSAGEPCDALAEALYPLNKPGVTVEDGSPRMSAGERDGRTVSAAFYEGRATALRREPGRRGGFTVHPLGDPAGWDERFRELAGIPPIVPAPVQERIVCRPDPNIGESIIRNDVAYLRALCARYGSDGRALFGFAARLSSDRALRREVRSVVSADLRDSTFDESLGFTIPTPTGEQWRTKCSFVFPSAGAFMTSAGAFKSPGEIPARSTDGSAIKSPEERGFTEFSVIDFVSGGTLLDYMFDFYDYPEEFR